MIVIKKNKINFTHVKNKMKKNISIKCKQAIVYRFCIYICVLYDCVEIRPTNTTNECKQNNLHFSYNNNNVCETKKQK